jgi:protoporphyrinogen/coproporphyrinogen III oxidase
MPARRASSPLARKVDVAVVGGGIAGLAAAHALAAKAASFVLLEASERWGGVIRTEEKDGFLLEGGPDSLLALKPEGIGLCRELGLGDGLVPTNPVERAVFVVHRGRLHPLPDGMALAVPMKVGPFLKSPLFSWPGKLRTGMDLLIPARKNGGDESIASFIRRRFGTESLERLGEPLLAGIHSGDPERLSIRATFPRLADLEVRHGSLVRGLWSQPKAPAGTSAFYSLRGGLVELVNALVAALPAESLRAHTTVRALEHRPGGLRVATDGDAIDASAVIVAVPAGKAAPLVDALVPDAARFLASIPFASTATVLLGYRREHVRHPLNGYGLVVPRAEGLRVPACSFFSTKFPGRAPEDHVLLRAFVGGMRDPEALLLDDAGLVETATRDLAPLLGITTPPLFARVFRWPQGTPQMEVGHFERLRAAEERVAEVPGLYMTGSGLRGTGIPDVVADARRVAAAALERAARG